MMVLVKFALVLAVALVVAPGHFGQAQESLPEYPETAVLVDCQDKDLLVMGQTERPVKPEECPTFMSELLGEEVALRTSNGPLRRNTLGVVFETIRRQNYCFTDRFPATNSPLCTDNQHDRACDLVARGAFHRIIGLQKTTYAGGMSNFWGTTDPIVTAVHGNQQNWMRSNSRWYNQNLIHAERVSDALWRELQQKNFILEFHVVNGQLTEDGSFSRQRRRAPDSSTDSAEDGCRHALTESELMAEPQWTAAVYSVQRISASDKTFHIHCYFKGLEEQQEGENEVPDVVDVVTDDHNRKKRKRSSGRPGKKGRRAHTSKSKKL